MSISEILGTIYDGTLQVCASAEAQYDGAAERVIVTLEAFTRHSDASDHGTPLPQPWLPHREHVREHLPRAEADAFVKDVFHSWVKKVRASVPAELPLRA